MNDSNFSRGLENLNFIEKREVPSIIAALADIAPDLARLTVKFVYGEIYSRPGLSRRYRQLATISALVALGNAQPQLKFHINAALNIDIPPSEVIETLIHIASYAGFPASLNGVSVAREVFSQRQLLPMEYGNPQAAEFRSEDRYQKGWAALTEIDGEVGIRIIDSLKDIAPDLARFIIEFAFGDIYTRPELDLLSREITTVAALTAMGNARPQLKVHINGLLNVGGSKIQLIETIIHTAVYAGFPAAINAMFSAQEVLEERMSDTST